MAFVHPSITRERAEELMSMKNGADGRFLIRVRPEKENEYVLGVLFRGRPTHHLITPDTNGVLLVNRKQYGNCTTPQALADFLSKPGVAGWPVPLTQGISPDEELIDMSGPAATTAPLPAAAPTAVSSQQTNGEAERKEQEEAERRAREEAEHKAREDAERQAREEAERRAREAADRQAREEAERRAHEEAETQVREDAARRAESERRSRYEAESRQAQEEVERQTREEAERQAREETARQQQEAHLQQMQRQQAYVPTAYPLDEDEPSSNGLTINGMLFDNSRGGLAANLLGDDPYSPPLSPAVGSQAYNAAIMNPAAQHAEQEAADARLRAERAAAETAARRAELQALSQHRGLSTVTSPGRNFSMSSEGYSEPVDVQLHKSLAKATIKLGARVTTLEAKVDQIMVSMDELTRMLTRMQGAGTRM